MPNRVIKDSITCSKQIESLTWFQEVMFYRLMVKADDFGRFYADPQIIKCELFPRKKDLTERATLDGLDALEKANLIKRYTWEDEIYLQIVKWFDHQQSRATKSKFPDENGEYTKPNDIKRKQKISDDNNCNQLQSNDINCNQMISDDINCNQLHPNTKSNTNTKSKTKTKTIKPLADDAEMISIQHDHDDLIEEAKEAGLQMTNMEIRNIVKLYGEYGKEAVSYGIEEASRMNKLTVAYIEAVAKNYGKEKEYDDDLPKLSECYF